MEDWQVIEPEQYGEPSPEDAISTPSVHRYNCQVSYVWAADALLRYQRNYLLRRINVLTEYVHEKTSFGSQDQERRLADFNQETVDDELIGYQQSIEHHMWLLNQVRQRLKGHASTMFSGSSLWTTGWLKVDHEQESFGELAHPVMYSRMPIFVEIVWKNTLASLLETGVDENATLALGVTCNGDVLCLTKSLLRLMEKILLKQNPQFGDEFDKSILLRLSLQRALRGSSWRAISVALGKDHAVVALGNGRVFTWAIDTGEPASGIRPVSVAGLQAYRIVKVVANGYGDCFALSRSRKILHWREDEQETGDANKKQVRARHCKLEEQNEVLLADDIWQSAGGQHIVALLATSSRLALSGPESPCTFHPVETFTGTQASETLDGQLVHCAVCPLRGSVLVSDAEGRLWRTTSALRPGQHTLTVEPIPLPPPWLPGGLADEWPGWDELAICSGMVFGITHLGATWVFSDGKWKIINLQGTTPNANRCSDSLTPLPSVCADPGNVMLLIQQLSYPDLSTPMEMIATRAESWNVPLYFSRRIDFNSDELEWDVTASDTSFRHTLRLLKPMGTTFEAFFKQADSHFSSINSFRLPSDLDAAEAESPPSRQRSKTSKIDWKMWSGGVKNWLNSLEDHISEDRRKQTEAQARKFLLHAQQVWAAMRLPVVSRAVVWDQLRKLYTFLPGCLYLQKKHGEEADSKPTQPLSIKTDQVTDAFIHKACSTLHYIVSRQNLRDERSQDLELMREASTTALPQGSAATGSSSEDETTVDLRHMEASAEQLLDEYSQCAEETVSISYEGFSIPRRLAVYSMGHILQDLPRTFRYCSLFNRMDAPLHRRVSQSLRANVLSHMLFLLILLSTVDATAGFFCSLGSRDRLCSGTELSGSACFTCWRIA
eukprot:gb/GECG01011619.1/.p1 GENE.gb/GECG01011619.1/~~gb/GECG01011619.1/.p1  ORF type:complete len:891 (+),score=84.71 gb/GECG01011619.1/:1-2673(+)